MYMAPRETNDLTTTLQYLTFIIDDVCCSVTLIKKSFFFAFAELPERVDLGRLETCMPQPRVANSAPTCSGRCIRCC